MNLQKKRRSGNNSAIGVARSEPGSKLLGQIRGKIHSELGARIELQGTAVPAIEQ
jgi:hypothetical protein